MALDASKDSNYFVCTLGQAAILNAAHPHEYTTVNDFLDHQARCIPDAPAVGFPIPSETPDDEWDYEILTFADLQRGSLMFAELLKRELQEHNTVSADNAARTVALLSPSSPVLLFAWLGLMRLGHAVLLLAPQCQPSAVAHLCRSCDVPVLFFDEAYEKLAEDAVGVAGPDAGLSTVPLPFMDSVDDLYEFVKQESTEDVEVVPARQVSEHDVAYLHHTSGTSTGLPKPIAQSHRAAVGVLPCFADGKHSASFTTTPLYHGGIADCFRAWTSGALIWLFPGKEVPITAGNVLKALECSTEASSEDEEPVVKYFSSVPYVLQMLAAEVQGLKVLIKMDIVGVGGAALLESAGNDLVSRGINLVSRFGSAECGFLMSSHRDYTIDKEWQFLRSSFGSEALKFEVREDGLSELVILSKWPHMAKRNREDGSFVTADLFAPHPNIPNAWKYHSRADSQLTLTTGKKFDPAPLEAAIATSPLLSDVFIFGNGQQYPGALLFRSQASSTMDDAELLDIVWPTVEKLNAEGQGHTRLSKAMLFPMSAESFGLEKSSKGTILRSQAEKKYAKQIENAFQEISLESAGGAAELSIPDSEISQFVLETIQKVTGKSDLILEDADLFSQGIDSAACMQIRAMLQKTVPSKPAPLPLNIVYDCGSIKSLSSYIINLRNGNFINVENELELMRSLVEEYGKFSTDTKERLHQKEELNGGEQYSKRVIILTGATGALGAHILDQLRSNPSISQIICLVRGADIQAARARVNKSLSYRRKGPLDESDSKVNVVTAKLGETDLGVPDEMLSDLKMRATMIIHAAWAVNFSMRLRSFVKDHIAGLRNLINFALQSQQKEVPRILFCSSTASVLGPSGTTPIPESISHDPETASPLGYSRSKWVAEAICEQAHLHTHLKGRISVLRIGQLCGDTENGIWNMTEAWPLMLSTVRAVKALPTIPNEKLAWLPVDVAAKAVVESGLGRRDVADKNIPVYHLVNEDRTSSWADLLTWMQHLVQDAFDRVSASVWVERLERLDGPGSEHPAKKLLGLWKSAYCGEQNEDQHVETSDVVFVMDETKTAAPVLKEVIPVGEEHFAKMWRWIETETADGAVRSEDVEKASVDA